MRGNMRRSSGIVSCLFQLMSWLFTYVTLIRRFVDSSHLQFHIPQFKSCMKRQDEPFHMPDLMLNIPFFYFLFSKPSDAMIAALSKIRQRVHLPALARELGKYYCHVFFPLILSLMYTAKSLALVNGAYGLLDIIFSLYKFGISLTGLKEWLPNLIRKN